MTADEFFVIDPKLVYNDILVLKSNTTLESKMIHEFTNELWTNNDDDEDDGDDTDDNDDDISENNHKDNHDEKMKKTLNIISILIMIILLW